MNSLIKSILSVKKFIHERQTRMSKFYLTILYFISFSVTQGQDLNSLLNSNEPIKSKCEKLIDLSITYNDKGNDSAQYVIKFADSLARKTNDSNLISKVLWAYSNIVSNSKKDLALSIAYDNFEICKKSKDCKLISRAFLLIGNINYWVIGNTEKGFENYELAIKEAEKCNDKATLLEVYEQSETIYFNTGQYEKNKLILIKKEKTDPSLKDDQWHNADFGDLYRNTNKLDSAIYYYEKAISISKRKNDNTSTSQLYFNYALIPLKQKNFQKAIEFCKNGIMLAKKTNYYDLISSGNCQLYSIYYEMNDFTNAKTHLSEVIKQHEKTKCEPCLISDYKRMSELNYELKDYKDAYNYLRKGIELFDKQNNAQANANVTKVEEDNLKKQKQLEIDLANEQKENERKVKNISLISLGVAFILILGIVVVLFKLNKSKKLIALQKTEVEQQKHLVEEKQREIVDSISYAKRLQEAILPPQAFVNKHLPGNFIYYQPKDIVAGDFYWAEKYDDLFFIAAADSTGHGVPGAMVSVVCSNALNRTLKEFKLTETGRILDKTRELVLETFEKSASEVKDGMDISLLCIDSKNKKIFWSGANNPLWYIQPSGTEDLEVRDISVASSAHRQAQDNTSATMIEVKADKQPIGKTDHPKPFTTHSIEFKAGTTFYLFTDGLADQFGGPKGKKFKYKQFSDLLLANHTLPLSEQSAVINKAFSDWKGNLEQVDDVCVIGVRV